MFEIEPFLQPHAVPSCFSPEEMAASVRLFQADSDSLWIHLEAVAIKDTF